MSVLINPEMEVLGSASEMDAVLRQAEKYRGG